MGTIAFVAALVVVAVGLNLFLKTSPAVLAAIVRKAGAWALIAAAGFLLLRGQLFLAAPLVMLALWILGGGGMFGQILSGAGWSGTKTPGQKSRVHTSILEMELDHDSGEMAGYVLAGDFAGRDLASFTMEELLVLLRQCDEAGDQSPALLEAYLDRNNPEWRETQDAASSKRQQSHTGAAAMTREEAYEVLGLRPGATRDDIRKAHRNLMKSFHPDQGGSSYLATKINQAKDLLLG